MTVAFPSGELNLGNNNLVLYDQDVDEVQAAQKDAETIKAYKRLFATPDGQFVLSDLKESLHDVSSFVPGEPHGTSFNEGVRSVYLGIQELISLVLVDPPIDIEGEDQ